MAFAWHSVLMLVWLKAKQSVCTHEMLLVCFVTENGAHLDYPCNHHLPDHRKISINNHKVEAERLFCCSEEKKIILSCTGSRVNDVRKILMTSQQKTKTGRPDLWLEHITQSRPIDGQLEVGSRRRFHHFLMDQRPGSSVRS